MKINNRIMMVLSIEEKINTKTGEFYHMLGAASIEDGYKYSIMIKDSKLIDGMMPMMAVDVNLQLSEDGKYGMRLNILSVNDIGLDLKEVLNR